MAPPLYFLCHNSKDKSSVRAIASFLDGIGVSYWLDERDIALGVPWYRDIFERIQDFEGALVFLGPHGLGRVQEQEIENILRTFDAQKKRVIPVILPGFHEERPPLPVYIQSQLVSKWNYLDLTLDAAAGIQRLGEALSPGSGTEVSRSAATATRLPRSGRSSSADRWFLAAWVALHAVGFMAITLVVRAIPRLSHPAAVALLATLVILALLLMAGIGVLRARSVPPDVYGASWGVLVAILASLLVVSQASAADGYVRAIGALATTISAGFLAGYAAGWLAGTGLALVAGGGAFLAAAIVPTGPLLTQDLSRGVDAELVVGLIGAMFWGAFLSSVLLTLARRHIQIRALLTGG